MQTNKRPGAAGACLIAIAGLILSGLAWPAAAGAQQDAPQSLVILYTNNTNAHLESCD